MRRRCYAVNGAEAPKPAAEVRICTAGNRKGRDIVRTALREASAAGLNVLRTFAHTTDDNFPFQVRDGPLCLGAWPPMLTQKHLLHGSEGLCAYTTEVVQHHTQGLAVAVR
jgi:hypothetical protein